MIPDLKLPGGVGNYYKCLGLDKQPDIDYMYVNKINTDPAFNANKSERMVLLKKVLHLPFIYLKFILALPKYNTVHVNPSLDFKAFFRDMGFIVISRIARKKVIVFFRGWEEEYEEKIKHNRFLSVLFRYSFAKADCYIVLGNLYKDKMIELGVAPNKPFHVETTIADSRFLEYIDMDSKIKNFDECVNILFMSRIVKRKGIYVTIDAFEKCQQRQDKRIMHLYIAGDGDELENATNYVKEKNIENVTFLGHIVDESKRDILLKCHITILPTMYIEGLPNTILEGMLYGMPIISKRTGGMPDVVDHEVNGYLLDHSDSEDFAECCLRLISDKNLYEKMAYVNYKKAKELFTTEAVKSRLLKIYDSLI